MNPNMGMMRALALAILLAGPAVHAMAAGPSDSATLERDLQSLSWPRFRAVVEAIPKLRNEVDRHGPAGWQFVQANYRIYPWKRNIDKLEPEQRHELAGLIERTRQETLPTGADTRPSR